MGIRTQFDKSRSLNSIRMKLFSAAILATGALADDRTFADKPEFFTAITENWTPKWSETKFSTIEENTKIYFDTYVDADNKRAQKVAGKMSAFLQGTRNGAKKIAKKCNPAGRRRRNAEGDEARYVVPADNPQRALWQLFGQHAEWVRNEIYTSDKRNCKGHAMRLFKRLDRYQEIWAWQFCSKISTAPQFCSWAYFNKNGGTKIHPRQTPYLNKKYGRDTDVKYTTVGCEREQEGETNAKLICPTGYIKILEAKYGRFGNGVCSKSGHPGIQKTCSKYVDVKDFARDTCEGQTECNIEVGNGVQGIVTDVRQDPCVGIPKYVQLKWEWSAEKPANPDDGHLVACEHGTAEEKVMNMDCPAGKTIKITKAEYGRWTTKTCTAHKASSKHCGHYKNVIEDARDACDGKQSCSYNSSNKTGGEINERGDPCRGVAKYTRVQFACD